LAEITLIRQLGAGEFFKRHGGAKKPSDGSGCDFTIFYWSGKFVVEALAPNVLLSRDFKDPCFEERYIEPYSQGRVSAITDIFQSKLQDCHIQLLQQFNVRPNLVVPISEGSALYSLPISVRLPGNGLLLKLSYCNN